MLKIKTDNLEGRSLDYAVCEVLSEDYDYPNIGPSQPEYSTDANLAVPLLEAHGISVRQCDAQQTGWVASRRGGHEARGSTMLVAGLRCLVRSELGDAVSVPDSIEAARR